MFARNRSLIVLVSSIAIACSKTEQPKESEQDSPASKPDTQASSPTVQHVNNPTATKKPTESVSIGMEPTDSYGWYNRGLEKRKAGDFKGALDAFDKSIEMNPKFAKTYFNTARTLLDLKRGAEALEMVERGLGFDSTSGDGWRLRARALSETGDVEGAMTTYKQLIIKNDADGWGLNNLGLLMMQRGDVHDALGPLSRAVQVQPTAPLFQNNLGMALERSGYKVAAIVHYQEAVKHDSSFTKAVKNLDRLSKQVTDSTKQPEVDVRQLAEKFRQLVKEWKVTPKD